MVPMIAKSSNDAWSRVIRYCAPDEASGGAAYRAIQAFLHRFGYDRTQGGRSSVGAGPNRLVARDLGKYLYDLHHKNLPGSEAQMKLLTTCATAARKGYRYIPEQVYGGGKTGTWSTVAHDLRYTRSAGAGWPWPPSPTSPPPGLRPRAGRRRRHAARRGGGRAPRRLLASVLGRFARPRPPKDKASARGRQLRPAALSPRRPGASWRACGDRPPPAAPALPDPPPSDPPTSPTGSPPPPAPSATPAPSS
jgi:hypothetical protein